MYGTEEAAHLYMCTVYASRWPALINYASIRLGGYEGSDTHY